MKSLKILSSLIFMLTFSLLCAQFTEVNVEISVDRMPEKERNDLKTLEQLIPIYFQNYSWFENNYGIAIPVKISMFPEGVNTTGFERTFTSQIFISNQSGDQRFFEKNFKFVYNQNDPLNHSDMVLPLQGTLDYYAYMLIAGELDTYDPLGGNILYEKARDIANRGQLSTHPSGWKQRLQELDEITRLRDYRMAKYYFWNAIDLLDQKKAAEVPEAISQMLEHFDKMFEVNARERYSHIFLDVHAREIAEIIRDYGTPAQKKTIMELDPDNNNVYKAILE
jgi:hypothetical protein